MHNLSKYLNMTAQLVQLLPAANPDPFSLTYLISTNLSNVLVSLIDDHTYILGT